MAKKGLENFTDKVAKELIEKQSIRDEKRKKREEYLASKHREAANLNNDIQLYIDKLDNIINITPREISIEEFIRNNIEELPKELLTPYTKPEKAIIRKPTLMEKIFTKTKTNYNLYVQAENEKYENEYRLYEENEINRNNEINKYNLKKEELIKSKRELYKNQDEVLISEYKKEILNQIQYPFEFKKCINTEYIKESKKLVIDYLLPDMKIVPNTMKYEYKKIIDGVKPTPMNEEDKNNMYNQAVYSIALNSIKNIFNKDIDNNIDTIVFNGYINDVDLSTGKDNNPYIISAMVDKDTFKSIDMNEIDKFKCLTETMKARVDINSNSSLNSITPIYKFDYLND